MQRCSLAVGLAVVIAAAVASMTGCRNLNKTENGALIGSGLGAATGAIIGHQTGDRDKGALIGAAIGGLGGGLLGNAQDASDERDAAVTHAQHQEMMRHAEQRAMTNRDVVDLAKNEFSDQHIISMIQNRGGSFDLNTASMIVLKQSGVSEPVIQTMANYNLKN